MNLDFYRGCSNKFQTYGHFLDALLLSILSPGKTNQRAVFSVFVRVCVRVCVWADAMHCWLMVELKLKVG